MILCNGFEEIEASAFTDVMGWSREHGHTPVHLDMAGLHPEVRSVWGTTLKPGLQLAGIDPEQYDALAIPGGFESAGYYEEAFDEKVLKMVRLFHGQKKPIASICVAALVLGKAGILKQCPATTYPLPRGERQRQLEKFGAILQPGPVVQHGHIITSTGPSTAMDVSFALLEMLTDAENSRMVKQFMGFETHDH